jgi:nicotinamide riboside transporter PnuC
MLDFIGAIFIVIGVTLTGKKNWIGWVFNICGQFIYMAVAIDSELYALLVLNIILTIIAFKNLYYWKTGKI